MLRGSMPDAYGYTMCTEVRCKKKKLTFRKVAHKAEAELLAKQVATAAYVAAQ
jgi:hypothetical protein